MAVVNPEILLSYASKFLLAHLPTILSCTTIPPTHLSCLLGNGRINTDKLKVGKYDSDANFINTVIKVQQQKEDELSEVEAMTIEQWKLSQESEILEESCSMFEQKIRDQEQKIKHAKQQFKSTYDPAIMQCIGGSAAEVERVWSMAGHVLSEHCASLLPLLFELIMYLKYNSLLLSLSDVIEANKRRKNESPAAKRRLAAQTERLNNRRADMTNWDQGIETDILID